MYPIKFFGFSGFLVLIVAECNVNGRNNDQWCEIMDVLIVAECNVNFTTQY